MSKTRKLAAIVFADVVGYSRLMGEDEGGTAQAVQGNGRAEPAPTGQRSRDSMRLEQAFIAGNR